MKILVTGGCGYKGSVLVPKLLERGHSVWVLDTQWFGNHLSPHDMLVVDKADIRNVDQNCLRGVDVIVHLASVANDPCGDLDPILTWEISALGTMRLADMAAREGVRQFIYASSASVYGIREEAQVTEDLPLLPISVYNQSKMVAERALLSYADTMAVQIIRPATVCGLSPRMRLDVAVNLLTMQALTRKTITVLGGNQTRPNIHIQDITDLYCFLVDHPEIVGIYNAGSENLSILDIAKRVATHTGAKIRIEPSNDPRSYRLNSDLLASTGFYPKSCVDDAIGEVVNAVQKHELVEDESHYNVNWMRYAVLHPPTARG